jgi:hypothetical protein
MNFKTETENTIFEEYFILIYLNNSVLQLIPKSGTSVVCDLQLLLLRYPIT